MKRLLSKSLMCLVFALAGINTYAGTHSLVESGEWKKDSLLYYDINEYDGNYDFNQEMTKIRELRAKGKEIRLIIGRGNNEKHHPPLPQEDNVVWVYADASGDHMTKDGQLHLWMSMDDPTHLNKLDDGLFSEILFDWSVLHFFQDRQNDFHEYARILKPNGKLFFTVPQSETHCDGEDIRYNSSDIFFVSHPSSRDGVHYQMKAFMKNFWPLWEEYLVFRVQTNIYMTFPAFLRKFNCDTSEEAIQNIEEIILKSEEIDHNNAKDDAAAFQSRFEKEFRNFKKVIYHENRVYPISSSVRTFFEAQK